MGLSSQAAFPRLIPTLYPVRHLPGHQPTGTGIPLGSLILPSTFPLVNS